jgi:hypothetical protein
MATQRKYRNIVSGQAILAGVLMMSLLAGCARNPHARIERAVVVSSGTAQVNPPGVVNYIWEEPMVDVVEVPPGLDPEGIYYRPAHQAVVEVRQGRWKYLREK